jgi:phosphohistidine phosphatase
MNLILWRHAEAEDGDGHDDAARELTKKGRRQAERMAHWLRPRLDGDWQVVVSPAKRTLQTVKPLEREFEASEAVGLDATAAGMLRAAGWPGGARNVLIVGHQPTLGQAAAHLMGGGVGDLAIRKGAIWWFETRGGNAHRETVLRAVLGPSLLEP